MGDARGDRTGRRGGGLRADRPATVAASQHELARARIADEDAFWAAHGDAEAVIGELAPATTPPVSLATLVHDDFLATDRLMAGLLYDLERREYWIVRGVDDVPLDQLAR